MFRMGGLVAASIIVTLLAGCGDDASRASDGEPSSAVSSAATETASAVVSADLESSAEVVDTGAEPRRELRFVPEVGTVQLSTMEMTGSTSMDAGGEQSMQSAFGPITTATTTEVLDVADNGDITLSQTIDDMTVDGADEVVAQMRPVMDRLVGVTLEATIDPVGGAVGQQPELPTLGDPAVDQLMGSLFDQLAEGFTALPVEPVGRGATWRVPQEVVSGGMTISVVTHYTVTELDGSRLTLDVRQEQSAEPTKLAGVRLESMSANGQGTLEIDLTSVLPTSSRMDVTQDMAMTVEQGGRSLGLDQRMQMSMRMTSQ